MKKKILIAITITILAIASILTYTLLNQTNKLITEEENTGRGEMIKNESQIKLEIAKIEENYLKCKTAKSPTCIAYMRNNISICSEVNSAEYRDFFQFTRWNKTIEKTNCEEIMNVKKKIGENAQDLPEYANKYLNTVATKNLDSCYELSKDGIMVDGCLAEISNDESYCGQRCDQQYYLQSLIVYDLDQEFCKNFPQPREEECVKVLNEKILSGK